MWLSKAFRSCMLNGWLNRKYHRFHFLLAESLITYENRSLAKSGDERDLWEKEVIIRDLWGKAWSLFSGIFIHIHGRAGTTVQLAEHLPTLHEDLGCNCSTAWNKVAWHMSTARHPEGRGGRVGSLRCHSPLSSGFKGRIETLPRNK